MSNKSVFHDGFKDTFLGALIGLGGFSSIVPNILGSISQTNDFGSFFSLRLFSMFFFLLPLIIFTTYWWFRGSKLYFHYITGKSTTSAIYHSSLNYKHLNRSSHKFGFSKTQNLWAIIFLLLKLIIPILFITDQFFIYRLFPFFFVGVYAILIWYFIIAVCELFVMRIRGKSETSNINIANTLVISIDLVFGIGIMAIVEPWIIYNSNTQLLISILSLAYFFIAFGIIQFIDKGSSENLFLIFAIIIITLSTFVSSFPVVSWNIKVPFYVLIIISLYILIFLIFYSSKKKIIRYKSLLTSVLLFSISLGVFIYFYSNALLKINIKYFENRKEASESISENKLFPFIFYANSDSSTHYYNIQRKQDSFVNDTSFKHYATKFIIECNHQYVDYIYGRSKSFIPEIANTIHYEIPCLPLLQEEFNVRKIYYGRYENIVNIFNEATESFKIHENINKFYCKIYYDIENDIIKKYILPFVNSNPSISLKKKADDYFHPINYYTNTLKRYKDDISVLKNIRSYSDEINQLDSLSKISGQIINVGIRKDSIFKELNRNLSNKHIIFLDPNIEVCEKGNNSTNSITNQKLSNILPYLQEYKNQQYIKRYKKAQIIFKAYLSEVQRIGLFILFYSLITILLLYWLHKSVNFKKQNSDEKENKFLDSLPGGFINISLVILVVLIVQIARPIKAEHINPESPHWMMDLDNWYQPTNVEKVFGKKDKTEEVKVKYLNNNKIELHSIKNAIDKTNREIDTAKEAIVKKLE